MVVVRHASIILLACLCTAVRHVSPIPCPAGCHMYLIRLVTHAPSNLAAIEIVVIECENVQLAIYETSVNPWSEKRFML